MPHLLAQGPFDPNLWQITRVICHSGLSWQSGAMRTKQKSLTSRLQAKEATAGNDRVKVVNDPAAGHGVSQPILHRLHLLEKQFTIIQKMPIINAIIKKPHAQLLSTGLGP